ncbi:putative carbonic anhydrase 3 [Schistocerca nitens]|uniref:putative carbonic anhydrase 3 n=1 Tax=Schistocerca nitens TaxID=7011 RepID=UPI0021190872|nr:putative carbonic anhydrase 3 [Schistocerca nitens]
MDAPPQRKPSPRRTAARSAPGVAVAFALAVLCCAHPAAGANWGYKGLDGPEYWGGLCKTGSEQSPVELDSASASVVNHPPLVFFGYATTSPASAVNNGHSVEVRLGNPCPVAVASGGLPGVYLLEQLHFHWEAEHTISGKRWPLELHLVHRNERYASLQEALKDRNGVAVVAVLFHVSDIGSHVMEVIGDAVRKVSVSPGASQKLANPINLQGLLPKDTYTFYRYHGSLTTPGCNESVVWTVFPNTIPVTKQQMEAFHRVRGVDLNPLGINYRPVQPINGREIQLNSAPVTFHSSLPLSIFAIILTTFHSQL